MGESRRSVVRAVPTKLSAAVLLVCMAAVVSETDPTDLAILQELRKGLRNPELLGWPESGGDPCGAPLWRHVYCNGNRVSQIQVRGLGLIGPLPQSLNKLSKLSNLGLQHNQFTGPIPSLSGLLELRYVYMDSNKFDSIALGSFHDLPILEVLALDDNNLNATAGWAFPAELQDSLQLRNLSLMNCNLVGRVPDFLGNMSSLSVLKLSMNRLTGGIPATFSDSALQILWLNDQSGEKMTGSIHVVASMVSLASLWLHGNAFSGPIPDDIGALVSLKDLNLNSNNLVGLVPDSLAAMDLDRLDLNNNQLMGRIPKFKASNSFFKSNPFCQPSQGIPCAPEVDALLDFLEGLSYPAKLVSSWSGNYPCHGPWLGLSCTNQKVSVINLPKFGLNGTLSPRISILSSLVQIKLEDNNLAGPIPSNLSQLKFLTLLDVSGNNLSPPIPTFGPNVKAVIDGNPLLRENNSAVALSPPRNSSSKSWASPPRNSPSKSRASPPRNSSSMSRASPPRNSSSNSRAPTWHPPRSPSPTSLNQSSNEPAAQRSLNSRSHFLVIVAPLASAAVIMLMAVPLSICYCKMKRKDKYQTSTHAPLVHPSDPSDSTSTVKLAVISNTNGSLSSLLGSETSSGMGESRFTESGSLVISFRVLRNVTKNFSSENELGHGGFGVVYKGELEDGTQIAVKRMEPGSIGNKAMDEFHAEISVLSKVRHRHLVSLLGYSVEGNERILVYEYMPHGALSKHLFHWKSLGLEPLSWKRRLNIALDVARGLEYLHSMAHQSFIHRDLKPSNILLGDDFRAKVSDFGLVKLAPDGQRSLTTRLAGTFGYLAPEYAVMGKITTKSDVFSFGVVLMELLTGLPALDEGRPEECQYLAAWFWNIKSDEKKLRAAIDAVLDVNEETIKSIFLVAELAGHCTTREPGQRPDIGHAVNSLAMLVEKWKPSEDETEEFSGIDYSLPLKQMVKGWQDAEGRDSRYLGLQDSSCSIPARPTGFAESFTSVDGR